MATNGDLPELVKRAIERLEHVLTYDPVDTTDSFGAVRYVAEDWPSRCRSMLHDSEIVGADIRVCGRRTCVRRGRCARGRMTHICQVRHWNTLKRLGQWPMLWMRGRRTKCRTEEKGGMTSNDWA